VLAGDELYISGLNGVVADARWTQTTISSALWYKYTLTASEIVSVSAAVSTINVNLAYYNPNFTSAGNSISLSIYRSTF